MVASPYCGDKKFTRAAVLKGWAIKSVEQSARLERRAQVKEPHCVLARSRQESGHFGRLASQAR